MEEIEILFFFFNKECLFVDVYVFVFGVHVCIFVSYMYTCVFVCFGVQYWRCREKQSKEQVNNDGARWRLHLHD